MWEVRAAEGCLDELVEWVVGQAPVGAQIYVSGAGDPRGAGEPNGPREARVVVIDPSDLGLPDPPASLVARPPHVWPFTPVAR